MSRYFLVTFMTYESVTNKSLRLDHRFHPKNFLFTLADFLHRILLTEQSVSEKMKHSKRMVAKEKILEAASKVFSVKGFEKTRMEDVAMKAGISKGTIYLYFKSKYDLFVALKKQRLATSIRQMETFALKQKAWETLESGLRQQFASMNDKMREIARLDVNFWASAVRMKKIRDLLGIQYDQLLAFLAEVIQNGVKANEIREDIDPNILAAILIAIVDGLELHWTILDRSFDWNKIMSTLTQVLRHGIEPQRKVITQ